MSDAEIKAALADIDAEREATVKHLKMAGLCYPPARDCARKLAAAALQGEIELDWAEVRRLAEDRAYRIWPDARALIDEEAEALQIRSPYHSDA